MVLLILYDCFNNNETKFLSIWLRVHKKCTSNQIGRLKLCRRFNYILGFTTLPISAVCWISIAELNSGSFGSVTNTFVCYTEAC